MKRTSVLLGIGLLAVVLISFKEKHKCDGKKDKRDKVVMETNYGHLFEEGIRLEWEAANLTVEDVHVIEVEEEIELGFNVADYLPEGFDPYLGMNAELTDNSIKAVEEATIGEPVLNEELLNAEEIQQLFTEGMRMEWEIENLKPADIHVIQVEEELDIDFDIAAYLPENFDPYQGMDPKMEDFLYLWMEEEVGLGFNIDDSMDFLAELFHPSKETIQTLTVDDIHVIELEEEIDLGIDVGEYLPRNFDPYAK